LKKTSTCLVLAAFVLFAGGEAFAEGRDSVPEISSPAADFPSSVGVYASSWSGGGLSYQRWYGSFGYAVTAGGYANPSTDDTGTSRDYFNWSYNVELDLQYRLFASNFWNWLSGDLFAYATVSHKGERWDIYDTSTNAYVRRGDFSPVVSAGVGIGYEIVVFRHFSIPLMFGYTAS
jgi:hypothetical protein